MMTARAAGPPPAGLIPTYAGTALYGALATAVGVLSVIFTYGALFAQIWSILLAIFSLLAIWGVRRTIKRDYILLEVITTALYVGFFAVYAVALMMLAILSDRADVYPAVLLPIIICIQPYLRLVRVLSGWIGKEK